MSISSNNSSYRRGVLLGLTMAEIIILIIFLLLLAFASLLKKEQEKVTGITNLTPAARASLEQATHFINTQPPEVGEKLVRGMEVMPEVIRKIEENDLPSTPEETIGQTILRGIAKLEAEKKSAEAAHQGQAYIPVEQQLAQEKEKSATLEEKVTVLEEKVREGFGPPPCWDTGNRRYTEYIYRAELTSKGIVLQDIAAPRWTEAKKHLPVQTIKLGKALKISEFIGQVAPLSNWSRQKDCRFLVNIADQTKPEEKELYQAMYETLYNHFQLDGVGRKKPAAAMGRESRSKKGEESFFDDLFNSAEEKPHKTHYN